MNVFHEWSQRAQSLTSFHPRRWPRKLIFMLSLLGSLGPDFCHSQDLELALEYSIFWGFFQRPSFLNGNFQTSSWMNSVHVSSQLDQSLTIFHPGRWPPRSPYSRPLTGSLGPDFCHFQDLDLALEFFLGFSQRPSFSQLHLPTSSWMNAVDESSHSKRESLSQVFIHEGDPESWYYWRQCFRVCISYAARTSFCLFVVAAARVEMQRSCREGEVVESVLFVTWVAWEALAKSRRTKDWELAF